MDECDTVPIFEVCLLLSCGSRYVEPLMVRWESKTDRVNLCEVGGVSLPLNIAETSWRLINRCYQH